MSLASPLRLLVLLFGLVAVPLAPAAAADADEIAVRNYVLSLDKVNRYIAATEALAKAVESDPALAAEQEAAEQEPGDTIAELRATVVRHPKLLAFFRQQGLSVDDAILLPFAIVNAMIVAETGIAIAEVNPAHVAFVKQNKALLEQAFATR